MPAQSCAFVTRASKKASSCSALDLRLRAHPDHETRSLVLDSSVEEVVAVAESPSRHGGLHFLLSVDRGGQGGCTVRHCACSSLTFVGGADTH